MMPSLSVWLCISLMPLLQDQCQQASFAEDGDLLSVGGYIVNDSELWWSLAPLHDRFRAKGEKRLFFKWGQFFMHGVMQSQWISPNQDDWIHRRKAQQPLNELTDTVATSPAIVAFLGFMLRDSRTQTLIDCIQSWLPKLCQRAVSCCAHAADIELENMIDLTVGPTGMVRRLSRCLAMTHQTVLSIFKAEWQSMLDAGLILSPPG